MSYIDGYFDRGADLIRVVERQNGERVFKEYPIKYTFYYEDPVSYTQMTLPTNREV